MPKLPEKIEDWTAPWEKEGVELDPTKIKKLTWDLLKDQEKNRAKLAEDRATIETLTEERDDFKDKLEAASKTGGDATAKDAEIADLRKEIREQGKKLTKVADYDDVLLRAQRYEVALDKSLSKTIAHRLTGKTLDELAEDADTLIEELGLSRDDDAGDGGRESLDDGGDGRRHVGEFTFTSRHTGTEQRRLSSGDFERIDPSKVELPSY